MAELKQNPDSCSGSQSNVYCTLNEDMRRIPSQISQKVSLSAGCMWCKRCWIPLMCGMLFVILLTTVSVSFKQQFSKLTEVENAVANLTASVVLLTSDQQDTNDRLMEMFGNLKADLESKITNLTQFKQQFSKLTEVENAVANLTASVVLLNSDQQDTNDRLMEMFGNLKADLESKITNLTQFKQQSSKLTEVENAVANLTASVVLLNSDQQDTNDRLMEMFGNLKADLETRIANLTQFKQQFSKLTEVENAVANLTASVVLLNSDQQDTNDRLMEMFGNLKADLETRIANLTRWKPVLSCKAGWQLYLSSCYLFSSTALDWQKSRDFCRVHEALLLILGHDTRERNFIVNHVSKLQSHWIGLTDHTSGQWRWIDGSPYIMESSQWEPGEPNNLAGEDCAEITKSGKLNDGICSKSFRFICKAPAKEN